MGKNKFIVANWKMNKTANEAEEFLKEFILLHKNRNTEISICPTFLCLERAVSICNKSNIKIGAQNCHFEEKGAFTGEVSPSMLKSIGAEYVILGHSERRNYFCETDEIINKKVKSALQNNLKPIICVGETWEEREKGHEREKIRNQIDKALKGISPEKLPEITIAYEPIWAIGTGKTVSLKECEEIFEFMKNHLISTYKKENVENTRLLYGGSMNEKNAKKLLRVPYVDGGLIGGASLDVVKFTDILKQAESVGE